ncbi:cyclin-like protein [Panus rudis PR-1116 ss-1]|nr:cyclin-like protein [Panus rudis PR-1116 ss-1]
MATDFWASSHYQRWIIDRLTVKQARAQDLSYVDDPEYLDFLNIYFANLIARLGKKLGLRQRVIATATIFFRRFYVKNAYCETDPFIVIAACCYVAAKSEESPVHIKNVVTEARLLFSSEWFCSFRLLLLYLIHSDEDYGVKTFPSDNSKLAEMEFYLVDDLECDLIVFHPYRTLMTLCGKEGQATLREAEAGEMGVGIDDGPRYWGTGEGKLELHEAAIQLAWFIINDTYRSELCLLYPPHLIAIAALYLTMVLHKETHEQVRHGNTTQSSRRSSRPTNSSLKKQPQQDIIAFLAGLNVNMSLIATIAQEIISLYTLWDRYKEDGNENSGRTAYTSGQFASTSGISPTSQRQTMRSGSVFSGGTCTSSAGTPSASDEFMSGGSGHRLHHGSPLPKPAVVTPQFLTQVLIRMREAKMADMGMIPTGKAYDKRLERAQAAG